MQPVGKNALVHIGKPGLQPGEDFRLIPELSNWFLSVTAGLFLFTHHVDVFQHDIEVAARMKPRTGRGVDEGTRHPGASCDLPEPQPPAFAHSALRNDFSRHRRN